MEKPEIRQKFHTSERVRAVLIPIRYYLDWTNSPKVRSEKSYMLLQSTALSQQIPLGPSNLLPSPQSD